ncbi:MAG: hypothetical protein LUH10_04125 [Tannerellaceae bacterium]|nr:hypothetical protein [Tannerellaceae bacterium]
MKLLVTLFLILSFYSSGFAQKQEESTKQKINIICDPSVEDMALYIIDDVYTITDDKEEVLSKINNSSILYIGLLLPKDAEEFKKQTEKTTYPDKIRKVFTICLKEGTPSPFETKE